MSDYAYPSPAESIHRRDDDSSDESDEGGMVREDEAAAARLDLGLSEGDDDEEEEEQYQVDRIIKARGRATAREYLVRWEGYGEDDDTWEPAEYLHPELIADFEREAAARGGAEESGGERAAVGRGSRGGRGERGRAAGARGARGGGRGSGRGSGGGDSSGGGRTKKSRPKAATLSTLPTPWACLGHATSVKSIFVRHALRPLTMIDAVCLVNLWLLEVARLTWTMMSRGWSHLCGVCIDAQSYVCESSVRVCLQVMMASFFEPELFTHA